MRTGFGGQRSPVMCSFEASPEPRQTQSLAGNISASVAIACALTAGW